MVSIALRISDDFKGMIDNLPWVNWSELAREELAKDIERAKLLDEIDKSLKNSGMTEEFAMKLGEELKEKIYKRVKSRCSG